MGDCTVEEGFVIACLEWLLVAAVFTAAMAALFFNFPMIPGTYVDGNQTIKTSWCGYSVITYKDG